MLPDMVLSAKERSTTAVFYEKVADDETAAPELRRLFARKANSLRILARIQATRPLSDQQGPSRSRVVTEPEALLFSPTRLTAVRISQWRAATVRPKRAVSDR
jgi:hypothetical protein